MQETDKWFVLRFKKVFRMSVKDDFAASSFRVLSGVNRIEYDHQVLYSNRNKTKLVFVVKNKFVVALDRDTQEGKTVLEIGENETVWYGNKLVCRGLLFTKLKDSRSGKQRRVCFEETRYSIEEDMELKEVCRRTVYLTDEPKIVKLFDSEGLSLTHY